MGRFVHILFMVAYRWSIAAFAAAGHRKAKGWQRMRNGNVQALRGATERLPEGTQWMWFHCASVGEYEQARPVIEAWRARHPEDAVLLTFYSVSGWHGVQRTTPNWWRTGDHIAALPLDIPRAVNAFLDAALDERRAVKIRGALLAKYDVWPVLVEALAGRGIPVGLFAAHVVPGRWPFRWGGGFYQEAWANLAAVWVQSESSVRELSRVGIDSKAVGDPRFDRVLSAVDNRSLDPALEAWVGKRTCAVIGSAWEDELVAARKAWSPGMAVVAVPHEWTASSISKESDAWRAAGAKALVWSAHRSSDRYAELPQADVLIVDAMGALLDLYAVAAVAIVGGGFGKGVHNTLEPAAHGVFSLVGPKVDRFREVQELQTAGALRVCQTREALTTEIKKVFEDGKKARAAGTRARDYALTNAGAAERIVEGWEKTLTRSNNS